jgi:copper chaperone CopZ
MYGWNFQSEITDIKEIVGVLVRAGLPDADYASAYVKKSV